MKPDNSLFHPGQEYGSGRAYPGLIRHEARIHPGSDLSEKLGNLNVSTCYDILPNSVLYIYNITSTKGSNVPVHKVDSLIQTPDLTSSNTCGTNWKDNREPNLIHQHFREGCEQNCCHFPKLSMDLSGVDQKAIPIY